MKNKAPFFCQKSKQIHSRPESGSILVLRLVFWDLFSWWYFYVTHHFSPQFERICFEFSPRIICKSKLSKVFSHPRICFKLKEPLCLVTFCLVKVKSVDVFLDPENPGPPCSPRQTFRKHQLLGVPGVFRRHPTFFTEPWLPIGFHVWHIYIYTYIYRAWFLWFSCRITIPVPWMGCGLWVEGNIPPLLVSLWGRRKLVIYRRRLVMTGSWVKPRGQEIFRTPIFGGDQTWYWWFSLIGWGLNLVINRSSRSRSSL